MKDTTEPEALLISGTVGAGKTTAAEAIADWLRAHRVAHAVIDLDALRTAWPSPPGDRFNVAIELANLTAVAANYLHTGAHRLVLAGVLEPLLDNPQRVGKLLIDELAGVRSARLGRNWRILYEVDDGKHTVIVLDIRHRSNAHRRR